MNQARSQEYNKIRLPQPRRQSPSVSSMSPCSAANDYTICVSCSRLQPPPTPPPVSGEEKNSCARSLTVVSFTQRLREIESELNFSSVFFVLSWSLSCLRVSIRSQPALLLRPLPLTAQTHTPSQAESRYSHLDRPEDNSPDTLTDNTGPRHSHRRRE